MSEHSLSSRFQRSERHKRHERHERHERHGRYRRTRKEPRREELDNMKCKIPSFLGDCKLDSYLNWELKSQVLGDMRMMMKEPCESWAKLKRLMRERFVPSYYTRDLFNKLERLNQGSKNVEEYNKKMEMNLMRAQIVESRKAIMARFLNGLNREI
ncbi:hypothetical protein CR513_44536, partial [Mucuna pruriens]